MASMEIAGILPRQVSAFVTNELVGQLARQFVEPLACAPRLKGICHCSIAAPTEGSLNLARIDPEGGGYCPETLVSVSI